MGAENLGRDAFEEFPNPIENDDVPLVRPVGADYRCTGCDGVIPGGMHVIPDVVRRGNDLVVVGIMATSGAGGAVTHACGSLTARFDEVNGPLEEAGDLQRRERRERAWAAARDEDGGR